MSNNKQYGSSKAQRGTIKSPTRPKVQTAFSPINIQRIRMSTINDSMHRSLHKRVNGCSVRRRWRGRSTANRSRRPLVPDHRWCEHARTRCKIAVAAAGADADAGVAAASAVAIVGRGGGVVVSGARGGGAEGSSASSSSRCSGRRCCCADGASVTTRAFGLVIDDDDDDDDDDARAPAPSNCTRACNALLRASASCVATTSCSASSNDRSR